MNARIVALAALALALLGCPSPQSELPAESPTSTAAPTDEAEPVAVPDTPAPAPTPTEQAAPEGARPCPTAVADALDAMRLRSLSTPLGEAVRSARVTSALQGQPTESAFPGSWRCETVEGATVAEFAAAFYGDMVGPRFEVAGDPPADARPLNALAEAAMGTWTAPEGGATAALDRIAECRSRSGVPLTSGVFVALMPLEGPLPTGVEWAAWPDAVDRAGVQYRATLAWNQDGERHTASWRVAPDRPGCEPADARARSLTEHADGVPNTDTDIRPRSPQPVARPSQERDPSRRAGLYVLAEEREIDAINHWVRFHERLHPLGEVSWMFGRVQPDGSSRVTATLPLGDTAFPLSWRVDGDGTTRPGEGVAALARAVQTRRLPGLNDPLERPRGVDDEAIAGVIQAGRGEIAACARAAEVTTVRLRWRIQWDGAATGLSVSAPVAAGLATQRLERCVEDVVAGWRFPSFAGAPVMANATVETTL